MRLLMLLALVAALAGRPRAPRITYQRSDIVLHEYESPTWERHIRIANPLDCAIWVYIECEGHLTVNPVGLAGRHTTEIVLPDIPPGEQCLLHHWYKQDGTKSPKPWSP